MCLYLYSFSVSFPRILQVKILRIAVTLFQVPLSKFQRDPSYHYRMAP